MMHNAIKLTAKDLWFYTYPILFALSYSQEILFSSNQNTKFISGLAHAGYRDIASDWMAHITDPFPLFSWLLKWQYQLLGLEIGIHLSFLIILAVYGFFGVWMARSLIEHTEERGEVLFVFSIMWLVIHTIGLRDDWLDLFPSGLAGQYMLGDYYQPCVFGVLLLIGIAAYASGRQIIAAICLILSPLFHPTYIISSVSIAVAIIILPANRSLGISWGNRLLFLSLIVLILSPYAYWITDLLSSGDQLVRDEAHKLLSETRIPRHALISRWDIQQTLLFFVIGFAAAWVGRKWLIGQLLLVMLLAIAATMIWAAMSNNTTLSIIAPWRVSVFLAPLSWVILLNAAGRWLIQKISDKPYFSKSTLKQVSIYVVLLACLLGIARIGVDYKNRTKEKYYSISRFLMDYHVPGNLYLIPPGEKHIRLEAGVPVYVTWKSHPTKDDEFLNWYKRIESAQAIYEKQTDQEKILDLIDNHSVTHVIWPMSKRIFPYSQMAQQVYSDNYYSLWDMR